MPILRKPKTREYTVIDNKIINNPNLSTRAKGMFLYMMSKPDDWKFNYKSFTHELNEGEDYIRAMLKELKQAGYLSLERSYDEKGRYEWIYTLFEEPLQKQHIKENEPSAGLPYMVPPCMGRGDILLNTNNTKDKIDKRESKISEEINNLNPLTINLIKNNYIDENDSSIFYYDNFLSDLLKEKSYKDLLTIENYVLKHIKDNNQMDEEGNEIKNKFGYFKESMLSNIKKFEHEDSFNDDEYDWLNDDIEL